MAVVAPAGGRAELLAFASIDALTLPFAQLLMSRSRWVGGLLLAATCTVPRVALGGLLGIAVSRAVSATLALPPALRSSGALSYDALLVGLGAGALLAPTSAGLLFTVLALGLAVVLASALRVWMSAMAALPSLTLAFIAVFLLLSGAAPHAALAPAAFVADPVARVLPEAALGGLRALGALVFLPRADAGLLVLAALACHSRIALVLAGLGLGAAQLVIAALPASYTATSTALSLNAVLAATALGGVWFVPGPGSYALALSGALLASLLGVGLGAYTHAPLLIVPFNAAVLVLLYALRQRTEEGALVAVDFESGTPEENLAYARSRIERFGPRSCVRLGAPFRGRWVCTQGVDGGVTHAGPWKHALDFEVCDEQGLLHAGEGKSPEDFYCYGLPVLAPAAGTVVRVVDGVPDTAVGELELGANWGNAVVVQHGLGVYSCVAHLQPGSVAVRLGQWVAAGAVLGRCGSSGRAPRPHIHLQAQASDVLGAPTLPLTLVDVVLERAGAVLREAPMQGLPREAEQLRALDGSEERAAFLRFVYGDRLRVECFEEGAKGPRSELLAVDVDLLGRRLLRSETRPATMYYAQTAGAFTVLDVAGDQGSVLALLRLALSRVLFDADPTLRWLDRVPLRSLLPLPMRPAYDALSPFGAVGTLAMRYEARSEGDALVIEGRSERSLRDGRPWVQTRAVLSAGPEGSRMELAVRVRGQRWALRVVPDGARAGVGVAAVAAAEEPRGAEASRGGRRASLSRARAGSTARGVRVTSVRVKSVRALRVESVATSGASEVR